MSGIGTTDPLEGLRLEADRRLERGLRRVLTARQQTSGVLDLASNDYLGLARDPRVISGAARAAREWGAGATGSRLVTGTTALHTELERTLAAHMGAAAGLVFSSGYLANLAVIGALAPAGSLVVSDATNHASIVDACRLARARVVVVPHRDPGAAEAALASRSEDRALVVTDAIFSVDGELAPLAALHAACRRQGATLVVDEAHSLGVIGDSGRGAVWDAGLAGERDVTITATLSKSLGSQGGAVLADPIIVEHLINTARPFIFDTALAPAAAGAALAALGVLSEEPYRGKEARRTAQRIADTALGLGLSATQPDAAVLSVRMGDPRLAVRAAQECLAHGVQVGCFRPPSVPDADSRLRITGRSDLNEADLARVEGALQAVANLLGLRP